MEWYHYVACFFSGAFLANVVPHFIYGIAGDKFPTPFSKPAGIGPSSPTVNVIWALFNLVIGYLLFKAGHVSDENWHTLVVFFVGIAFMSIQLSAHFRKKKVD